MDYKILDILSLNDGKKYVIVDICEYHGSQYAFLVDIIDNKNYMYVEIKENGVLKGLGKEQKDTIIELNKILSHDTSKIAAALETLKEN